MAITVNATPTLEGLGSRPSMPVYMDRVKVTLDNSYPTGGYSTFKALFEAVVGKGRTIAAVVQQSFPAAFLCTYDTANDKLMAFTEALAQAPNGANLSAMVDVELLVISY